MAYTISTEGNAFSCSTTLLLSSLTRYRLSFTSNVAYLIYWSM